MAKCTTNKTDRNINALIEFKRLIFKAKPGQYFGTTLNYLDKVTEMVTKVDDKGKRFYALTKDTLLRLKHTVTSVNQKENITVTPEMEAGTYVHSIYEELGNLYIKHGTEYKKNLSQIYTKFTTGTGFKLSKKQLDDITTSFDQQIKKAEKIQDSINKKLDTKDKFEIRVEQMIIDPDYPDGGIGGTIDLLFVFSNNTGMIVDFKSSKGAMTHQKMLTHQAQMNMYKKILINSFGMEDVLETNIVPVNIGLNKAKNQITYLSVSEEEPGLYNKTGYSGVDEFLKKQYNLIQELETKRKGEKSAEKREELDNRILGIRESIRHFLDKKQFDNSLEYINKILRPKVEARLKEGFYDSMDQNTALEDIQNIMDELYIYRDLGKLMVDFMEIEFTEEERKEALEQIDKIQGWATRYNTRLDALKIKLALPESELDSSLLDAEGNLRASKPLNFTQRWFTRLSDVANPIFKMFSNKVLEMNQKIDLELREIMEDLENVDKNLKAWGKKSGFSNNQITKMLLNDKGVYHDKISSEGRELIKTAFKEENVSNLKEIFEIKDGWKERFEIRRNKKIAEFELIYGEGTPEFGTALKNFDDNNDLSSSNQAWLNKYNRGNLKRKSSFNELYKSEQYRNIENTPELKAWYDKVTEYNDYFREILGVDNYSDLPENFYPNIRAEILETMMKDPKFLFSNPGRFIDSLGFEEDDTSFYKYNESGELKEVPKYWINPIDAKLKSYDILNSTIMFSKTALNYKYAKEYEATAQALKTILADSAETVETPMGKTKWGYAAERITGTNNETIAAFNDFVDYYIYGIKTQDQGKNFKLLGKEFNTVKVTKAALRKTSQMGLGLNFIAGIAGGIHASTQMQINSYKNGVYSEKQVKKARQLRITDRKKSLALLAFMDAGMDTAVMKTINKNKAGVRKWVNERMLFTPYRVTDESVSHTHTLAMMQNYGLDSQNNIRRLVNLPEGSKSLYELAEINLEDNSEQVITFEGLNGTDSKKIAADFRQIARHAFYKVTGSVAEEDIYRAKTSLLADVLMQFKSWMPGVVQERFASFKADDITDTMEVGRYTAFFDSYFKSAEGMDFKNLLASTGKNVVKVLKDLALGASEKTSTVGVDEITYKRINLAKTELAYQHYLNDNPSMRDKITFQEFVTAYEGQLRAGVIELRLILGMFLALLAMASLGGDDDPLYKKNQAYRVAYKMAKKTLSEMAYFYNPTSLSGLVNSGIPLVKTFIQATQIITNGFDSTIDLFQEPDKKDKTPFGYYTIPFMIPGFRGMRSLIEPYTQDKVVN